MPKLVGHEKIIKDIKRLAEKNGLSHGYIFSGSAMTGKRTTALALARFLEKGDFALPAEGEVLQDAKLLDAAGTNSIGIDAVREIKNFLWQRPNVSPKRTLIIDQAELLTTEAQNALLKITEEPPASSLLIIVTSDTESLMDTIQSRLQKIYFGAVPQAAIAEWLVAEHVTTVAKAPAFAERAVGKPGLAWKLAKDIVFRENLEQAEKFLRTTSASRKEFLKKLLEPDEFNLRIFLDALIMNLAWEKSTKASATLWHKTLGLYGEINNFSLNPRLQLENLLTN